MEERFMFVKFKYRSQSVFVLVVLLVFVSACVQKTEKDLRFEITFPESVHPDSITGRVYVILAETKNREPRLQIHAYGVPFFGKDIDCLSPGASAVIDQRDFGYPLESLSHLPHGDYYVQGFVNVYTKFERSDGHVLWMHNDQWEGQRWNRSPGNLYSEVKKITIPPSRHNSIRLNCDQKIPPVQVPPDTKWVKRLKFQSKMLTEFWGKPVYLGATVLLPKGYDEHPDVHYPVNYIQGHFSLRPPHGFQAEEPHSDNRWAGWGHEFYKFWVSDDSPRMLLVTFQHPCPYYDDSYGVNSPNTGPYGDAIIQELIPMVEQNFRIIQKPYARILSGGSTGGWISLALQIFYPEFFGGTWSLCPDPVDFRYFQCINIYKDENAYTKRRGWIQVPTPSDRSLDGIVRLTSRQRNHMELAMGTRCRSGEQIDIFQAVFGPIGEDGYVKPLFDKRSGDIDPKVAQYWREHYDLRHYLERNWERMGQDLEGKIHIYVGDMDTYYLNNAVKLLERFLERTTDPYYNGVVEYGDGRPHCWGPDRKELLKSFQEHILNNAPDSGDVPWLY
ncbi:MAG: hypothetical protein GF421_08690 [Candidatus Aminicenantes bacterium]|nr:hypothetical protein [Candidatus Aminicenantes bacterium]